MTMVLAFTRTSPDVTHLVERFSFPGGPHLVGDSVVYPPIGVRMHCGNFVEAPVDVFCDFIANLKNLCDVCWAAWTRMMPDQDHMRVAYDILQERGVTVSEDVLRLMIGKPKESEETAPFLADLRAAQTDLRMAQTKLAEQVMELQEALDVERRTMCDMQRAATLLEIGALVRTCPDYRTDTVSRYRPYSHSGGQRHDAPGAVVSRSRNEDGVVYLVKHRQYPEQDAYYLRHELQEQEQPE